MRPTPDETEEPWGQAHGPAPRRLDEALALVVGGRRWQLRLAEAAVHERWTAIVGEDVARHVVPVRLHGGVLVVRADSGAWATQIRALGRDVARRAAQELGEGAVKTLKVVVGAIDGGESRP